MARVKSKEYITVLQVAATPEPISVIIGKGIESMSTDFNAEVEKTSDILGNVEVSVGAYQKQTTVEPYYFEDDEDFSEFLQSIIDEDKILDDLKCSIIKVKLYEDAVDESYPGVLEEGIIEVTSDVVDANAGRSISFNLHYKGNPVKGTYNPSTKQFNVGV